MKIDLDRIQNLIDMGYIYVRQNESKTLNIYNYTNACAYSEDGWEWEETKMCRGLITDNDGNVVALPFPKFFNWDERGLKTSAPIKKVYDKIDGSLGILYREDGQYKIATRGSFNSDQAIWATNFLNERFDLSGLPDNITLLFEIVYPENRIVIDYGPLRDLILLGAFNYETGEEIEDIKEIADTYHFNTPLEYDLTGGPEYIVSLLPHLGTDEEGFVVLFEDGQRFKFKGEKYFELHKLIFMLSPKNVLKAVIDGEHEEYRAALPDEFLAEFDRYYGQIHDYVAEKQNEITDAYNRAVKSNRRDFAHWVMSRVPNLKRYMFLKYDGKPVLPHIYKDLLDYLKDGDE